ncbi:hypothetical protein [Streptomyces sp. N35]|uniref:hypothetical protein n=1 Tax=Streptomyces sp. N35 TaxID=2795730 RepID=UPI0018F3266A|nr:hypothetical protein [Streptomyces sp. N35]
MFRTMRRALRRARLHIPVRPLTARAAHLPPTARDALGEHVSAEEAITFNRGRVATASAVALYRGGLQLPLSDAFLDNVVRALGFPYSRPSRETRAAIRAALAVLEADPTITR